MLRFGIIGTGRISDWVLKGAIQDPRFKAVAVCSRSAKKAREFIDAHPEAFTADAMVFTSVEQMAQSPVVDAIYIGTPNSTHFPYTITCLNAGKHVLCEKPMGCSEREVQLMADAAQKSGKVLMEAMISTLNPIFRISREAIARIGSIHHYSSFFCQYSSKYEALKRGEVANSFNPQMGGGALADIGIYTTYPLISLFGYPDEVKASIIPFHTEFGDTDVQGAVTLKYPSMTASLAYSKVTDSDLPTEICGEGGTVTIDHIHIARKATFTPHAAPSSGRGKGASAELIAEGLEKDEYFYEFEEFINTVEGGKKESAVNSLRTSILNARLMDAILTC